jgi:hypothetical protein
MAVRTFSENFRKNSREIGSGKVAENSRGTFPNIFGKVQLELFFSEIQKKKVPEKFPRVQNVRKKKFQVASKWDPQNELISLSKAKTRHF